MMLARILALLLLCAVWTPTVQVTKRKPPPDHADEVLRFVQDKAAGSAPPSSVAAISAVTAHRTAIRDFLEVGQVSAAEQWLDEVVGFTSKQAESVVKDKLRQALVKRRLVVGVMGISTTAGHDCHHNQSFPYVFARHLAAPLAVAGVEVEVRNHAVGGYGTMPSHFCVETLVGDDIDVLVWDFQMMAPRGDCRVEHFVRAALHMPTQPVVMFWQGGVWLPKDGKLENGLIKPPQSNVKQSCGNQWMVKAYAGIGTHYGNLVPLLHRMRYLAKAPLLSEGTDPLYADPLKGTLPAPDFGEPHFDGHRRLARHHPGPRLHRLWGLAWAHAYLGLWLDALHHPNAPATKRTVPPIAGCIADICDDRPLCATTVLPRVRPTNPRDTTAGFPLLEAMAAPGHDWQVADVDNWQAARDKHGYQDQKLALRSRSHTPLTLRFTVDHPGKPLTVCETPCPWGRCKPGRAPLFSSCTFALDGNPLRAADFPVHGSKPGPKYPPLVDSSCTVVAQALPRGPHELTITPQTAGSDWVLVSHLIYY